MLEQENHKPGARLSVRGDRGSGRVWRGRTPRPRSPARPGPAPARCRRCPGAPARTARTATTAWPESNAAGTAACGTLQHASTCRALRRCSALGKFNSNCPSTRGGGGGTEPELTGIPGRWRMACRAPASCLSAVKTLACRLGRRSQSEGSH
jgi:hypothetical protein